MADGGLRGRPPDGASCSRRAGLQQCKSFVEMCVVSCLSATSVCVCGGGAATWGCPCCCLPCDSRKNPGSSAGGRETGAAGGSGSSGGTASCAGGRKPAENDAAAVAETKKQKDDAPKGGGGGWGSGVGGAIARGLSYVNPLAYMGGGGAKKPEVQAEAVVEPLKKPSVTALTPTETPEPEAKKTAIEEAH